MNNNFSINLKNLAGVYSQKKIATDTGASTASITNYINNVSEPSLNFLIKLKSAYSINIEDFLFKTLDFSDHINENNDQNKRFEGSFIIYYYDSSPYKGNSTLYSKNLINYGVVSIYKDTTSSAGTLTSQGVFLLNRKDAEQILSELENISQPKDIKDFYSKYTDVYNGTLDISNTHIFLSLKNYQKEDHCFIILNNPPSGKPYVGGMATVNSISRGREHMPCIQYLILSRFTLNITDGEMYNLLALESPDINVDLGVEQLIKLFKSLYINQTNTELTLTEYQKKRIIEESFKNTLEELLEDNIFRFAKISDMEDDKYYRLIKEEMIND